MYYYVIIVYFLLGLSVVYPALQTKKIDLDKVQYTVPASYTYLEGCIHRKFTIKIVDPKNVAENNTKISSEAEFNQFVCMPLRPMNEHIPDNTTKEQLKAFFTRPLYVYSPLDSFKNSFANCLMSNIRFITIIKNNTLSFKNNQGGDYKYINNYLPGYPDWPGDIILLIDSNSTKKEQIKLYKDQLTFIIENMCKEPNGEEGKYYYRKTDNMSSMIDSEKDDISKQVIYVKNIQAYLSYLKDNVNSFNLETAVTCFNHFTETGQMKGLSLWTMPRYQITGGIFILAAFFFYRKYKKEISSFFSVSKIYLR